MGGEWDSGERRVEKGKKRERRNGIGDRGGKGAVKSEGENQGGEEGKEKQEEEKEEKEGEEEDFSISFVKLY